MSDPDLGLFGPDSVTWRVHADPVLWVAGVRALLLQALHPAAMAGIHRSSTFRRDPWGRLLRTADYVGTVTYGSTAEAHHAAARIRRLHASVSTWDRAGAQSRVDDPDLLLWVHCCEVDSFLSTVRRAGLRLSATEADRYVAEQVRAARLVGVPVRVHVPSDVAGLAAYFGRLRPELVLSGEAAAAARFLLLPPMPLWVQLLTPARLGWAGVAGLAAALLPRWARRLYRLPALPTTDLAATAAVRTLRTALIAVPGSVREGPHLRRARDRMRTTSIRRLEALPPLGAIARRDTGG